MTGPATTSYELLAADHSPVGLLVLSGDGTIIRHVNHTMAQLLGLAGALQNRRLAELAPGVAEVLTPLVESVRRTNRPRRAPGVLLPFPSPADRQQVWDAACAPLPPNSDLSPPHVVAVWLWPEDVGAVSSRKVAETLRQEMTERLPAVIPGFEVSATLVPSEPGAALGGDTYDVIPLGGGRWAVLMGDVAGRGPAAAARAIMVRHSIRVLVLRAGPGEALNQVSRLLIADPSFTGFVTAFLGVIDAAAGTLTYVVAGHDPALILRAGGHIDALEGEGALPLAVDADADYSEHVTPLAPTDTLLLYTDGLTDTRRDAEFFDEARVRSCLLDNRHLPAPALVACLLTEASTWAGDTSLRDDTAILVVRGQSA